MRLARSWFVLGTLGLVAAMWLVAPHRSAAERAAPGQHGERRACAASARPAAPGACLQLTPASWLFAPQLLNAFAGPYATPPAATRTVPPAASGTVPPTATGSSTSIPRPSRTPTPTAESVDYPQDSGTIILQIGWTYTDTVGQVWQEMEGTPWLTLYGDGRLIAGHALLDRAQELYEAQLDEAAVRAIMDDLAYRVTFFSMQSAYEHPETTKPSMHVFARVTAGTWRVTLRGWEKWATGPAPSVPGAGDAMRLVRFVKDREAQVSADLTVPYIAESATILAQELRPSLVPDSPVWPLSDIDVAAIADAAPLAFPSPIDRLVGHLFVGKSVAVEARAVVVPMADQNFPFEYRASEFRASGRPIAVGVRQEVPGGSLFLPDNTREGWYRADRGSGQPPLARQLGLAAP